MKLKVAAFVLVSLAAVMRGNGGDPQFPVAAIPAELKTDVNVVVREDQTTFRIHSKNKASLRVYQVITVLNANGNDFAEFLVFYDKLRKITSLRANVYNAGGELVKRLKSSEIYDQSAFDGFSLYSDNRLKAIDLKQTTYPYTVEVEYTVEYKYLYGIAGSVVVPEEKMSVQHWVYQLIYPPGLAPRYKPVNIAQEPKKELLSDGNESVTWDLSNVKPVKFESHADRDDILSQIIAAPTEFDYEGYPGKMETWRDLGHWIGSLNKGRDVLPEPTKEKVRELTKGLSTIEEKTKVLYEYLQSKTRYVSIQLGIGGLQPFEASVVDKVGYGDCKALSNYMVSLLKEAGVQAHYAIVEAGRTPSKIDVSFPSDDFNHVIVCVPNQQDTLWLECTSQTNPFGYLGKFTGNRYALIITDNGGELVKTKFYKEEQNVQSRTAEVYVDVTGDAQAKVQTTYAGIQYENGGLEFILGNQYDDQKKWVLKNTSIPTFDLNSFNFINKKEMIPSAIVQIDLTLRRLASVSGKRMFLTPNLMNRSTYMPEKIDERKTDIVVNWGYVDLDTVRYHLPEDIYPEFLPEPIKISSRFGEYEASFKVDQGSVVYMRKIKIYNGRFPKESYGEYSDFYRNINKADNSKLVFLNKT